MICKTPFGAIVQSWCTRVTSPKQSLMEATGLLIFCSVITAPCVHAQQATNDSNAVAQANRPFTAPEMMKPTIDEKVFAFTDVGAKIPNYTPGRQWGAQGAPLTEMQNPLPAEMSIKAYSVPQSFSMSLWAKELNSNWPEQSQRDNQLAGLQGKPIAMNWDERGRLWICETIDYPNELQPVGKGRDRIKICEDTDNDGRADKFTVFAEHLSIPSTLVCYRGGVIVQDGQSTIYLKDIDGDDRADFRQVLITGWAMGDTHGGVSNFQYGPDNWIWGMQGYNNSSPVINGQKQMSFRQGFWRFKVKAGAADETAPAFAIDKSTHEAAQEAASSFNAHTIRVAALEFVRATNNNTWGLGFSEEGYVFGSTANNCPSVHMPIPNRYYDRVAGWSPTTLEKISPDAKFKPLDDKIRQVDVHGGYTAAAGSALTLLEIIRVHGGTAFKWFASQRAIWLAASCSKNMALVTRATTLSTRSPVLMIGQRLSWPRLDRMEMFGYWTGTTTSSNTIQHPMVSRPVRVPLTKATCAINASHASID